MAGIGELLKLFGAGAGAAAQGWDDVEQRRLAERQLAQQAERDKMTKLTQIAALGEHGIVPEAQKKPTTILPMGAMGLPGQQVDAPNRYSEVGVDGFVQDSMQTPAARAAEAARQAARVADVQRGHALRDQEAKRVAEAAEWDRQWQARTTHENSLQAARLASSEREARIRANTSGRAASETDDPFSPEGLRRQQLGVSTQATMLNSAIGDVEALRGDGWRDRASELTSQRDALLAKGDSLTQAMGGNDEILQALRNGRQPGAAAGGGGNARAQQLLQLNQEYDKLKAEIERIPDPATRAAAFRDLRASYEQRHRAAGQ